MGENTNIEASSPSQRRDDAVSLTREFLTTIVHDLRASLNASFLWLDMLELGLPLTEEATKATKAFRRSLEKQSKLIGHLVDAGEICLGGRINIYVEIVLFEEAVEAAVSSWRAAAVERGVRLEFGASTQSYSVAADPQRLKEAVSALLEHALSSTPAGGLIAVAVREGVECVELSIRDSGGMSSEDLQGVFVPFWKGRRGRQEALGLGLVIAQHLIEGHGGQVRVSSDGVGKGTTFTVSLPVVARSRS